jgi:hypothetical protein
MFCDPCPEVIAQAMIHSVRRHMDCEIVQLTDLTTPMLDGVDSVRRLEGTVVSSFLARHLANLDGETLYLDYDTVVMEDVSTVFEQSFDLAITKRTQEEIDSRPVFKACPHNVGVMFSRSPALWKAIADRYDSRGDEPSWMKFQIIVTEAINVLKEFTFLELPSERYNYTPNDRLEDLSGRSIVHYKGFKKSWMVHPKYAQEASCGHVMVSDMMSKYKVLSITKDHPYYAELHGSTNPPV